MAHGNDNKSEHPTRRRLEKAREKGQIARSKEVPSAAVLSGGLLVLMYFGEAILDALRFQMSHLLKFRVPSEITVPYLAGMVNSVGMRTGMVLVPVLLAVLVFSVAANVLQGGLVFSTESLKFHFEKLSPQKGFSRIFSKNGLVELIKSLILLFAVSIISYRVIAQYIPLYPRLVLMDVRKLFHWTATISYEIFIRVAVLLIVLAIADYYFQKYRFIEQLKMTKEEVKQEFKETEGDPITKGRIRRIQREMARKRMMSEVPNADVVITNPTHYSVALKYKMDTMDAPMVVAKGVGFLALKIRELAQEHQVPLVENKQLAQTLYKSVEIGQYIPGTLYKAVAEILAYVYKAKNTFYQ
jgi:flagellar biosynthetic protein FlhB